MALTNIYTKAGKPKTIVKPPIVKPNPNKPPLIF